MPASSCSAGSLSPPSTRLQRSGSGAEHISPLWMAAIAWTVVASLAGALWQRFRHHDWSAFSHYELPKDNGESHDFALRTGPYSWLREREDQLLHDYDHLR